MLANVITVYMNPYRTKKGPNIIPHHARIFPGSKTQRERC